MISDKKFRIIIYGYRLLILKMLNDNETRYKKIRDDLGMNTGDACSNLRALKRSNYIDSYKTGKYGNITMYKITPEGRKLFEELSKELLLI